MGETNLERLRDVLFSGQNLEWVVSQRLGPAFQFVEDDIAWYINKKGTDIIYVQPKQPTDALATCYACGERILLKHQRVTRWAEDGPGPCAGVDVQTRDVRYCPKCEEGPKDTGIEITSDYVDV